MSKNKKVQKRLKFEELLHRASKEIGLTKIDEKKIIDRQGWNVYNEIKAVLKEAKSKLLKKVILGKKTIIVPAFDAGKCYPLQSEYFRGEEIFTYFKVAYPATDKTTLIEAHFSGEVRSQVIGETVGNKLYSHAITPTQAENIINQIGNELLTHTEDKVEAHFILFIKGSNERREQRDPDDYDDNSIILVSTTIYTYRITPERKKFSCHPALIGVVNSKNVTQGGFWLEGPWAYTYLLNKEVR
ncbi:MAG: hypothetical protein NT068_00490 [Candidatus Nomurabacteria bacterium]|nr:hypothetical protein [Candidatus Nomurabacteria bacterium]